MTEQVKKEKPQSSKKAKVNKRAKYKKVTAISIRLPEEIIEEGESPKFFINYVLSSGQLVKKPCTHKVWKDINNEGLFKKFRYEFDVFEDSQKGIVQHLNARLKSEHLPAGFNEQDVIDSAVTTESAHLEVGVSPDNELSVNRAPSSCTKATEDEVLESISSDMNVKSGDYLLGKYRVEEIREREGHKTIFVDVKFRE
tara:strand:+ start:15927 stop:16520 length:594 start_codon:yes stop_codon:yes gene_type:complete